MIFPGDHPYKISFADPEKDLYDQLVTDGYAQYTPQDILKLNLIRIDEVIRNNPVIREKIREMSSPVIENRYLGSICRNSGNQITNEYNIHADRNCFNHSYGKTIDAISTAISVLYPNDIIKTEELIGYRYELINKTERDCYYKGGRRSNASGEKATGFLHMVSRKLVAPKSDDENPKEYIVSLPIGNQLCKWGCFTVDSQNITDWDSTRVNILLTKETIPVSFGIRKDFVKELSAEDIATRYRQTQEEYEKNVIGVKTLNNVPDENCKYRIGQDGLPNFYNVCLNVLSEKVPSGRLYFNIAEAMVSNDDYGKKIKIGAGDISREYKTPLDGEYPIVVLTNAEVKEAYDAAMRQRGGEIEEEPDGIEME